jgi:hypothetical protein
MSTVRAATSAAVALPEDVGSAFDLAVDQMIPHVSRCVTAALPIVVNAAGQSVNASAAAQCPPAVPVITIATAASVAASRTPEAERCVNSSVQKVGASVKTCAHSSTRSGTNLSSRSFTSC